MSHSQAHSNPTSSQPPAAAGRSVATKNMMNMGICGLAGTVALGLVYPMESIKTVIQLKSEIKEKATIRSVLKDRFKTEGLTSLYRGLAPAAIRQFLCASLRLGLYFNLSDYIKAKKNKPTLTIVESTLGALGAAAIGLTAVMPFDVVYVRFQAENAMPKEQRRGYTSMVNALTRIVKEEGFSTLWRGVGPAVGRGMATNFGMLVPYEKCKAFLSPYLGYTRKNYCLSSAIAGLGATICALPFDNVKVRLQRMKPNINGTLPYTGVANCFVKCVRNEGFFSLWSGFLPCLLFAGSQSMLALLITDALRIFLSVSNK